MVTKKELQEKAHDTSESTRSAVLTKTIPKKGIFRNNAVSNRKPLYKHHKLHISVGRYLPVKTPKAM